MTALSCLDLRPLLLGLALALPAANARLIEESSERNDFLAAQRLIDEAPPPPAPPEPKVSKEDRELQGKVMIDAAFKQLEKKNLAVVIPMLRVGVHQCPGDWRGRQQLAVFYFWVGRRQQGWDFLLEGFDHAQAPRASLEFMLNSGLAAEEYERAAEAFRRALVPPAGEPLSDADRRWLVEQRVRLLRLAEREADALAFAETAPDIFSEDQLIELRLFALWRAKRFDDAALLADSWRARAGSTPAVLRLLVRAYRETGRFDEMSRVLDAFRQLRPGDPGPHVYSIIQLHLVGREAKARAQTANYLYLCGANADNLIQLASSLLEIKRPDELGLVFASVDDLGVNDERLEWLRVDMLVAQNLWAEARIQSEKIPRPTVSSPSSAARDFYRLWLAAAADPSEDAQSTLLSFIGRQRAALPVGMFHRCVERLQAAGRTTTAREVLRLVEVFYPGNPRLTELHASLELSKDQAVAAPSATSP